MGKSLLYIAGFGIIGVAVYGILKQIEKMNPLKQIKDVAIDIWETRREAWNAFFESVKWNNPGNPSLLPLSRIAELARNEEFTEFIVERSPWSEAYRRLIKEFAKTPSKFCLGPFCFGQSLKT